MSHSFDTILAGLKDGSVVPFIGPGALAGITDVSGVKVMPADSHSLILALNNGAPMAPKLMFEFSRAAMNVELKRGRGALTRFLDTTYRDTAWNPSPFHQWLADLNPAYVIDINRDTFMQQAWAARPHLLIVGVSRLGAAEYRYKLFQHDGESYRAVEPEAADTTLPVLFKPVGTPLPESNYIASDADFVDYLTELMGGFAIPGFIKKRRPGLKYLLLGTRVNRDTERMLLSDIAFGAADPAGWALITEPTDKERRYLERQRIEVINADVEDLLAAAGVPGYPRAVAA